MPDIADIDIRTLLLTKGIRTIGFTFSGGGDSGNLDGLLVPPDPAESLLLDNEYPDLDDWLQTYSWHLLSSPVPEVLKELLNTAGVNEFLEKTAYNVLDHFDGDWCNNEGGYGSIGFDLLTGDYCIEGWERIVTEQPAHSQGVMVWSGPNVETTNTPSTSVLNVVSLLKTTLTS